MPSFVRHGLVALAIGTALLLAGCSKSKGPTAPETPVKPTPNSPENALALIQWCWEMKDVQSYRTIFVEDYIYGFAPADSQGIGMQLNRTQELDAGSNLFGSGTPGHPAPTRITMKYPKPFVQNDDRPGKTATYHKLIDITVNFTVLTPTVSYATSSAMRFYFVRGDSALIPLELGLGPDPSQWYLENWQDDSSCPKRCATVGKIKIDYQSP